MQDDKLNEIKLTLLEIDNYHAKLWTKITPNKIEILQNCKQESNLTKLKILQNCNQKSNLTKLEILQNCKQESN